MILLILILGIVCVVLGGYILLLRNDLEAVRNNADFYYERYGAVLNLSTQQRETYYRERSELELEIARLKDEVERRHEQADSWRDVAVEQIRFYIREWNLSLQTVTSWKNAWLAADAEITKLNHALRKTETLSRKTRSRRRPTKSNPKKA